MYDFTNFTVKEKHGGGEKQETDGENKFGL